MIEFTLTHIRSAIGSSIIVGGAQNYVRSGTKAVLGAAMSPAERSIEVNLYHFVPRGIGVTRCIGCLGGISPTWPYFQ